MSAIQGRLIIKFTRCRCGKIDREVLEEGHGPSEAGVACAPNQALEPTAYSFGSAALRLRFRRRLTAGVRAYITRQLGSLLKPMNLCPVL
jgi:hypothetical protein